jgi:hypothetical protein
LTTDEMPMLRHVKKDHIVPELQLLECLYRLMIAAMTTTLPRSPSDRILRLPHIGCKNKPARPIV